MPVVDSYKEAFVVYLGRCYFNMLFFGIPTGFFLCYSSFAWSLYWAAREDQDPCKASQVVSIDTSSRVFRCAGSFTWPRYAMQSSRLMFAFLMDILFPIPRPSPTLVCARTKRVLCKFCTLQFFSKSRSPFWAGLAPSQAAAVDLNVQGRQQLFCGVISVAFMPNVYNAVFLMYICCFPLSRNILACVRWWYRVGQVWDTGWFERGVRAVRRDFPWVICKEETTLVEKSVCSGVGRLLTI